MRTGNSPHPTTSWFSGALLLFLLVLDTCSILEEVVAFSAKVDSSGKTSSSSSTKGKGRLSVTRLSAYSSSYEDRGDSSSNNNVGAGGNSALSPQQIAPRLSADRPTQTYPERDPKPSLPGKPKIVVLGATGKIGRLVVRQLLEMSELDATIVAFVRDYDKACRVLYDDIITVKSNRKGKGPRLEIVKGDLIPPEELPGQREDYYEDDEEAAWLQRASSAAKFYGTNIEIYNDTLASSSEYDDDGEDSYSALERALKDCTAIISCVGSVRPTNLWTDIVKFPLWRLLKADVSGWCSDDRHPYYVHYSSTRKVLALAEKEQMKRQQALEEEEKETGSSRVAYQSQKKKKQLQQNSRIRFVRVSDLCVSQAPFNFVPVLTNALHSMVFRYQAMAEAELENSRCIDTIVLRPGDLIDEDRNHETTALQVNHTGALPKGPSIVGREDVASLAVAAALFKSEVLTEEKSSLREETIWKDSANKNVPHHQTNPFHHTLAVRWVSENMAPYPSQGCKGDGLATAALCLKEALKSLRRRRREIGAQPTTNSNAVMIRKRRPLRGVKPYGFCVALPVYLFLFLFSKSLLTAAAGVNFPGRTWLCQNPVTRFVAEILTTIAVYAFTQLRSACHLICATALQIFRRKSPTYIQF